MRSQLRWVAATMLAVSSWSALAGSASARPVTHVVAHVTPATAYLGSAVTISGTVKPSATVTLVRLVGRRWKAVAHQHPRKLGAYSFSVKVPRTQGVSAFRVVSGKTVSHKLSVRATKAIYHVGLQAVPELDAGATLTVSGAVSPKATGSVSVQQLLGATWVDLAKAKLTAQSTYSASLARPAGSYRLRVVKPFSAKVAGGVATPTAVTIYPAPAVATTSLPRGSVSFAYSAALTAIGGKPPYTWKLDGSARAAGLTLSPGGLLSGVPNTSGDQRLTVLATDALGVTASGGLDLTITPPYGQARAWGAGLSGALGDGSTADTSSVVAVHGLATATSIVGAGGTGYALLADGTVSAWGQNDSGELGDGSTTAQRPLPGPVHGLTDVTAIAGSEVDGYALKDDGTVWAWGSNYFGNLGDGSTVDRSVPGQVPGLSNVIQIAAGDLDAYFLTGEGSLWAVGRNAAGELGDGSFTQTLVPVRVLIGSVKSVGSSGSATGFAVTQDGSVWTWGYNGEGELGTGSSAVSSNLPAPVPGLAGITQVAGGSTNGYSLSADGVVEAWGSNYYGQLGHGGGAIGSPTPAVVANLSNVSKITAGRGDAYALLSDGTVDAWGSNVNGQLGGGGALGGSSSMPLPVAGLTGVSQISAGEDFAMALQTPSGITPIAG